MQQVRLSFALIALSVLLLSACEAPTTSLERSDPALTPTASMHHAAGQKISATVRKELAAVRQATARYHDLEAALADGYTPASPHVPGMGTHYARFALVDGTFEAAYPEVLVYLVPKDGKRARLVAVEYVVPVADLQNPPPPPEGFTGDADVWEINPILSAWTLHAWVWMGNPDGIFSPTNPNIE